MEESTSGKITTQQYYQELIKTNEHMAEMERRLLARLDQVIAQLNCYAPVDDLDKLEIKVDKINDKQIWRDVGAYITAIVAGIVSGIVGTRQ